ncbi:MAG: CBS domain-containing protein [Clostridia bacterium]|nr:CBS domain-containing protein [Clostridia bacterium]
MDSNSQRFLEAYNRLDKGIRDIYGIKPSITFSDCVRKVATVNSVIKKYEETLIEYGRLRNAIVHSDSEEVIAEPNLSVVEKLEHIARLVCTPPRVMDTVANRSVLMVSTTDTLKDVIVQMFKTGYSVIPVYNKETLAGVVTRKIVVESMGAAISAGVDMDDLSNMPISEAVDLSAGNNNYEVVSSNVTIDTVLYLFQSNRKLSVVVITKNGNYNEKPLGLVTTTDTIDMQTILDNY